MKWSCKKSYSRTIFLFILNIRFLFRFRGQLYGLGTNHTKYKGGKTYTTGERTTNGSSTTQGDCFTP